MSNDTRIERIKRALATLNPSHLELIDEGALHAGHAGAATGLGHFALTLTTPQFSRLTPLQRQRLIYQALGDLMQTDIHSLRFVSLDAS